METAELFMLATRKKYTFASVRGPLTVLDLWDLPLTSKTGFDLDTVAKNINAGLKEATTESFVTPAPKGPALEAENKLAIVVAIIRVLQDENTARLQRAEKATKKQKLLEALANREQAELSTASKEELLKQLAELD